eukprot:9929085-Prorocentrum_lima.AAC.1
MESGTEGHEGVPKVEKGPSIPPMGTQGPDTSSWSGCNTLTGKIRDPPRKFVEKPSAERKR